MSILEIDATQPHDDGLVDFIVIEWGTNVVRFTTWAGGFTPTGTSTNYEEVAFDVGLPELGDELLGGFDVKAAIRDDVPDFVTLMEAVREVENTRLLVPGFPNQPKLGEFRATWFQWPRSNVASGVNFFGAMPLEGLLQSVSITRSELNLTFIGRDPMDQPAGLIYNLDDFPSLQGFEAQGEFLLPPAGSEPVVRFSYREQAVQALQQQTRQIIRQARYELGPRDAPRGAQSSFSEAPTAPDSRAIRQQGEETGRNEEAELGSRVPEGFGADLEILPDLVCPPLVDVSTLTRRSVQRWYVVGRGSYDVTDVRHGAWEITQHPYYLSHRVFEPGQVGMLPREWTTFLRGVDGLDVSLLTPTSTTSPSVGDWTRWIDMTRPGPFLYMVVEFITPNGVFAPEPLRNDTAIRLEYQYEFENNQVLNDFKDVTDTGVVAGYSQPGNVWQFSFPFPFGPPLRMRMRIRREHTGGLGGTYDRTFRIRMLGTRDAEAQQSFPNTTMLQVVMTSIPAPDLTEVMDEPVVVRASRREGRWDSSGRTGGTITGDDRVGAHIVETLHLAGRAVPDRVDFAQLFARQSELDQLDRGRGGFNRMVFRENMSVEEQVRTFCDHHRIVPTIIGSKLEFGNDRSKAVRTLFTSRQYLSDLTISVVPRVSDPPDVVAVEWFDAERQVTRTTFYPPGASRRREERIRLPGLMLYSQAYRRAQFEWEKRQRRLSEAEVALTEEARHLRPGDRVMLFDRTRARSEVVQDGWGAAVSSDQLVVIDWDWRLTSQALSEGANQIAIRDRTGMGVVFGELSGFVESSRLLTLTAPHGLTDPGDRAQQRLTFITYRPEDFDAMQWTVSTVKDNRDGVVDVKLYGYEQRTYDGDLIPPPEDPYDLTGDVTQTETELDT